MKPEAIRLINVAENQIEITSASLVYNLIYSTILDYEQLSLVFEAEY